MWVVEVGETNEMDEKGRITIPAEVRKAVGKKAFEVELADKDTIILKAFEDRSALARKVADIKLTGDRKKASADAAAAKDLLDGIKDRES